MKYLTILFFCFAAQAKEIRISGDTHTLVAIEYGTKNVDPNFHGVFYGCYLSKENGQKDFVLNYEKSQNSEFLVALSISDENKIRIYQKMVDVRNWTNGYSDVNSIFGKKVSLSFPEVHRPMSNFTGQLPEDLSIVKYVIGRREGDDVSIVVYQSENLESIKKYVNLTPRDLFYEVDKYSRFNVHR